MHGASPELAEGTLAVKRDEIEAHGTVGSPASPEDVEQAVKAALTTAIEKLQADSADSAKYQYFSPRRLGATAPHSCEIWDVDYRVPDQQPRANGASNPHPSRVRRIGDEGIVEQIDRVLNAGLRVSREAS